MVINTLHLIVITPHYHQHVHTISRRTSSPLKIHLDMVKSLRDMYTAPPRVALFEVELHSWSSMTESYNKQNGTFRHSRQGKERSERGRQTETDWETDWESRNTIVLQYSQNLKGTKIFQHADQKPKAPLGLKTQKNDEKNCRLRHRPHEPIGAASLVGGVFELQHRRPWGKREAWRYLYCPRVASSLP